MTPLPEIKANDLEKFFGNRAFSVTPVCNASTTRVLDATNKYLVESGRARYFLIVANATFPSTVALAVNKLFQARHAVGTECQKAIEPPLLYGHWDNLSYGMWPYRPPLSNSRPLRLLQKRWLYPKVFLWLCKVAQHSKQQVDHAEDVRNRFLLPLEFVASHGDLGEQINTAAKRMLDKFTSRDAPLVNIFQHGDLWLGNILLRSHLGPLELKGRQAFQIIDWAGATEVGYPFFDFIKLSMSCGRSVKQAQRDMVHLSHRLGCHPNDATAYFLSGLGQLGCNLNCFPERSFVKLGRASFAFLEAANPTWQEI